MLKAYWRFEFVNLEQPFESPLPLNLGMAAEILTVQPKEVEGVVAQPVLSAGGALFLEFGETCSSFVDDYNFTINDSLAGKVEGADDR